MEFKLGAKVYTSDNQPVGTVDHIVLEPETKAVTHLVVRKGLLFGRDKVIPVSAVQGEGPDGLILQQTSNNLDDFPDFEEKLYLAAEGEEWAEAHHAGGSTSSSGSYLVGGMPLSVTPGSAPQKVTTTRNIPEATVPLKIGSKVTTSDNHHVGNVERVITEPETGKATSVIMTQGLLVKTRKELPIEWVTQVVEDEVFLTVDGNFIDSLPEYLPEMQS
jgi:uncharacterized protein YrrD